MAAVGYGWLAVFYGLLLLIIVSHRGSTESRIFSGPFLPRWESWLMGSTFITMESILLCKAAFSDPGQQRGVAPVVATAASLAIVAIVASASWAWIESPLIGKAHRYFRY